METSSRTILEHHVDEFNGDADDERAASASECSSMTDEEMMTDIDEGVSSDSQTGEEDGAQAEDALKSQEDDTDSDEDEDFPPLELNYEALRHIADYYLPGNHGKCTKTVPLTEGGFHEILVLKFEDGWSCIGRFARNRAEHLCVTESEYATMEYVRKHTSILVPETYFVNFDPTHAVGAPFVLMEMIEGVHLYKIWQDLTLEHKKVVMSQIANVLVQLAGLKFDRIGSLNRSGVIGQLQNGTISEHEAGRGPFDTSREWMLSFLEVSNNRPAEVTKLYPNIRAGIAPYLEEAARSVLRAPYHLIHGDFDAQNIMFHISDSEPPKLSGIIDWDYSFTGPLYYLLEYPIFIRDNDGRPQDYSDNKLLRKHFVRSLVLSFPKGSKDREDVRDVFRSKSYQLHSYNNIFMRHPWNDPDLELNLAEYYLKDLTCEGNWETVAYEEKLDFEACLEVESEDEVEGKP